MDTRGRNLAPAVGVVACLLVLLALAAPFALVEASNVFSYYGAGAITPLAGGLLAIVGSIVFAAGRNDRTDPSLAAGVTLVLGVVVLVLAILWAVTVPDRAFGVPDRMFGLDGSTIWTLHQAVLVVASGGVAASAGWYARSLGLL